MVLVIAATIGRRRGCREFEIYVWSADGATCDRRNVVSRDAKIGEFALRKTIQLVDGLTITPPVAV